MKKILLSSTFVLLFGLASACAAETNSAPAAKPEPKKEVAKPAVKPASTNANEVAVLKTSEGEMVLEFWSDVAPNHVENFKKLAKEGFYDGTCFHRVIKGFMIQGGDPNSKDESKKSSWGMGGPGHTVKAEFNSKAHVRGVLSMARSQDPNSAGSQFFTFTPRARRLGATEGLAQIAHVLAVDEAHAEIGRASCRERV